VCDVTNLTLVASLTLNVTGSVSVAQYPLIRYQGSIGGGGYGVVSLGSLPPNVSGYLSNNTAHSSIDLVVTSVPGSQPTIAPVTVSGTNLVVSVPTVTGANFVLQTATNLTPTILWANESTNAGTGGNLILIVPIEPGKPQKFVRFWVY
jgi:hypothetical protein